MAWREATSCETISTQRPSRVWRRCQDRFDACAPVACGLLAFQRGRPNLTQLASPIGWSAGACASRKLSVSLRHLVGEPGNWSAASRSACVQRCLSVENCRHVTHSQASGRCSLFAACRKLIAGQQARDRQTLLVRDELEGERSRLAYDSTDGEACDARSRMPVWAASDRRYEDCMGPLTARREDGSGATTCEPSLVGLRGDCRGGSCSPFSATALVVFVSHPERVPILHAYARWFASLTFMVTGSAACAVCKDALERLRPASAGAHTDATESGSSCTCVDDFDNTRPYGVGANYSGVGNVHISFARVMLQVASARPGLAGIVYMHADFVLNVRRFAGAPLADIWTARAGHLGLGCLGATGTRAATRSTTRSSVAVRSWAAWAAAIPSGRGLAAHTVLATELLASSGQHTAASDGVTLSTCHCAYLTHLRRCCNEWASSSTRQLCQPQSTALQRATGRRGACCRAAKAARRQANFSPHSSTSSLIADTG